MRSPVELGTGKKVFFECMVSLAALVKRICATKEHYSLLYNMYKIDEENHIFMIFQPAAGANCTDF